MLAAKQDNKTKPRSDQTASGDLGELCQVLQRGRMREGEGMREGKGMREGEGIIFLPEYISFTL